MHCEHVVVDPGVPNFTVSRVQLDEGLEAQLGLYTSEKSRNNSASSTRDCHIVGIHRIERRRVEPSYSSSPSSLVWIPNLLYVNFF